MGIKVLGLAREKPKVCHGVSTGCRKVVKLVQNHDGQNIINVINLKLFCVEC